MSRRKSILFAIVVCIISGSCALASLTISNEQVKVENVVYDFMRAKADRDVSPSYQSVVITKTEIYETISVYDAFPTGPHRAPEYGVVARVNGLVVYEDKRSGSFQASLEKKDGIWQLVGIIMATPSVKDKQ